MRCRYVQPDGIGYLDAAGRVSKDASDAERFETESDAWAFARNSGERVPDDCWVEPDSGGPGGTGRAGEESGSA